MGTKTDSAMIVDASALVALANQTDSTHQKALAAVSSFEDTRLVVIPAELFAETINIMGKKISREVALNQARELLSSPVFTIMETTPEIKTKALTIWSKQTSDVSYTDCLVMACADALATKQIFGFDRAFKANGYTRVGLDDSPDQELEAA